MFGAVKLAKYVDIDLYNILDMVLDLTENDFFSIGDEVGRNVIIFRVDMSSSSRIDNKKKILLFLVKILHKD